MVEPGVIAPGSTMFSPPSTCERPSIDEDDPQAP